MPNFDGTGPMGRGPRSGGGRGYCYPAGLETGSPPMGGRGRRRGRGQRGFARRHGGFHGYGKMARREYYENPPMPVYGPYEFDEEFEDEPVSEKEYLEGKLEILRNETEKIRVRLDKLHNEEKAPASQ